MYALLSLNDIYIYYIGIMYNEYVYIYIYLIYLENNRVPHVSDRPSR